MRKKLVIVILLIILLVFLSGMFWKEKQNLVETFSVTAVTKDEIKDELIIAVYNYETDILDVEKTNGDLH